MRESVIENYLRKRVKAAGGEMRKVRWIGRRGAPDDLVLLPRRAPALVECKATGKKPTKTQADEHALLRTYGFTVMVLASIEDVDRLIG